MIGITLEIAAHFGMIGIERRIVGKRKIDEAADVSFGIDMQRFVGGAHPAVIVINPQAADFRSGFENRDIDAFGRQIFCGAKPPRSCPYNGEMQSHNFVLNQAQAASRASSARSSRPTHDMKP